MKKMQFPKNKSQEEIEQYWLDKAKRMSISAEDTQNLKPLVTESLSTWQIKNGAEFWTQQQLIEDAIREALLQYPGEIKLAV